MLLPDMTNSCLPAQPTQQYLCARHQGLSTQTSRALAVPLLPEREAPLIPDGSRSQVLPEVVPRGWGRGEMGTPAAPPQPPWKLWRLVVTAWELHLL